MRINSPLIIRFVNLYGPDDTILAKLVQLSPNCSIICLGTGEVKTAVHLAIKAGSALLKLTLN